LDERVLAKKNQDSTMMFFSDGQGPLQDLVATQAKGIWNGEKKIWSASILKKLSRKVRLDNQSSMSGMTLTDELHMGNHRILLPQRPNYFPRGWLILEAQS